MNKFLVFLLFPILMFGQLDVKNITTLFKGQQYLQAEKVIIDFLTNHPNHLQAIELLGDAYGHQKKWDQAIVQYKRLLEVNALEANYHYKYGGVLGMKALENKLKSLGFIGDIKASFLRAAELDPNHIEVRWALVELYMQLPGILGGSKSKSLTFAEELENLSTVDGYLAKGYIYEYDDEPELAEKYYRLAINVGGSLTCFSILTSFYESTDKPDKAIKTVEDAQQKYNRNALHYQIGKIAAEYNVQLQKGEQCLKAFIENYSIQDGVPKAWAHYRLAQIHMHKKNKQEALKYIDLALAELPKIKPFKVYREKIMQL
ncbi:lipopolysaccharide assembly protein LapB [Aestuariivivens sp. NBU2969]|uniref:tetratricopeptide repeat protein n=1 Tax=Aestuariivivens sp. NBU2969 TaxID=2873267 RepID=UPI001CC12039|nr:tetratricopeptide repeat protein [Aestuariivivens sp. NBU2969]